MRYVRVSITKCVQLLIRLSVRLGVRPQLNTTVVSPTVWSTVVNEVRRLNLLFTTVVRCVDAKVEQEAGESLVLCLRQDRLAGAGVMFSTCPFVIPSVRPSVTKLVNTIF